MWFLKVESRSYFWLEEDVTMKGGLETCDTADLSI